MLWSPLKLGMNVGYSYLGVYICKLIGKRYWKQFDKPCKDLLSNDMTINFRYAWSFHETQDLQQYIKLTCYHSTKH